jgi:hypothetical protein
LNNDTDAEYHHGDENCDTTAYCVGEISVEKGSHPGTKFQNRCQHSLLDTRLCSIVMGLREKLLLADAGLQIQELTYSYLERLHCQNLGEHSLVVCIAVR